MAAQMVLDGDPDKVDVSGYTKGDVLAADTTGTLTPVPVGADTEVFTANSADAEGVEWAASSGGSGTPSNTVVTETTFGQASAAGASTDYSRGDHTHGTPAAPTVPTAGGSVVTETSYSQASTAGVAATYSRSDHTHGTVALPTPTAIGLGNVDNTSDANKPISTATQTALNAKQPKLVMRQAYIKTGNVTLPNTAAAWLPLAGFELQMPAVVGDYVDISTEFFMLPNTGSFLDIAVIVGTTLVRYMSSGTGTPAVEGLPGYYPDLAFRTNASSMGFTVTAPDLDGANVRWVMVSNSNGLGTLFASTNGPFYWRSLNMGAVL